MKGEIDRDFYCSADDYKKPHNCVDLLTACCDKYCKCYHRKWPTPKQFLEEYGEEYPYDGAVYWITEKYKCYQLSAYIIAKHEAVLYQDIHIVCACTPWGKPPAGWRPE